MAYVDLEVAQGVGVVWLRRPEVKNALHREMKAQLKKALTECQRREDIRVVAIRGEGDAFSAGEDLRDHLAAKRRLDETLRTEYHPLLLQLVQMRKPTIAVIDGVAAGAGVSLALACDLRLASDRSRFVLAFSGIGLVPDAGLAYFLPRVVGLGRALQYAFLGERITAEEALKAGLVQCVVARDRLEEVLADWTGSLAEGPTTAFYLTRLAFQRAMELPFEAFLAYEAELQAWAGKTEDHAEGVRAFLAKEPPRFRGR